MEIAPVFMLAGISVDFFLETLPAWCNDNRKENSFPSC